MSFLPGDKLHKITNPRSVEARLSALEKAFDRFVRLGRGAAAGASAGAIGGKTASLSPTDFTLTVTPDITTDGKFRAKVDVAVDADFESYVTKTRGFAGYAVRLTSPTGEVFERQGSATFGVAGVTPDPLSLRGLPEPASGDGAEAWQAQVRVLNSITGDGAWSEPVSFSLDQDRTPPADPTGVVSTALPGAVRVDWDVPTEPDYALTEVWVGSVSAPDTLAASGPKPGVTVPWDYAVYDTAGYTHVFVRHADKSGNYSSYVSIPATPKQVDTEQIAPGAIDGTKLAQGLVYNASGEESGVKLVVTDGFNASPIIAANVQHLLDTGTAGDGMGVGFGFQAESATGPDTWLAWLLARWNSYLTGKAEFQIGVADGSLLGGPPTTKFAVGPSYVRAKGGGLTSGTSLVATGEVAAGATDGFVYVPTVAGRPTGVPTVYTGTQAIVWDTTNKKWWMYRDGDWVEWAAPEVGEVSLIDRARLAPGWRNLGTLTGNAFRESDIIYDQSAGLYRVYSTGLYETQRIDVRSASTPEGIAGATPVTNIAPLKYPTVVKEGSTYHLYGTQISPTVTTAHYTSTSPDSGFTKADEFATRIIDTAVRKHPLTGKWYAIGFLNLTNADLKLLRADGPGGPWTDMGNVFADTGFPPFANGGRPDPTLALGVDGRDYIMYSGYATTMLEGHGVTCTVQEIDLATGRVKGAPVALMYEAEAWHTTYMSDAAFVRVAGQPDRICAFSNDGGVAGNYAWGCLDLAKIVVPADGRRPDALVKLDPRTGMDIVSAIRPTLLSTAAWSANGLVCGGGSQGAIGYPAAARMDDFTFMCEFTPSGPQGASTVVAHIAGASYDAGPRIVLNLISSAIRVDVQGVDHVGTLMTSGVTVVGGTRYSVVGRKAGTEVKLWVNGALVYTGTHPLASNFAGLRQWSLGLEKTLTQVGRNPFVGTVHSFEVIGSAMGLRDIRRYT